MGIYINPENMSKENWLAEHATRGPSEIMPNIETIPVKHRRVCVVDNGAFTAAGVAFDEDEAAAFNYFDGRPKFWFIVPDEKLEEVTGITLPPNRAATGGRL